MSALRRPRVVVRQVAALCVSAAVPAVLVFVGGHRGVHMARNLLIPGAGLVDHWPVVAALFMAATLLATVLWLRWGAGWIVGMLMLVSTVLSGVVAGTTHDGSTASMVGRGAHEFPFVVLVLAGITWARTAVARMPGLRWLTARRHRRREGLEDLVTLGPVDRCRAVSLLVLAGRPGGEFVSVVMADDVRRRARRVGAVARLRVAGDPFRRDHAHARSAMLLCAPSREAVELLAEEAGQALLGAVPSEPSWVRPLDATLCAIALEQAGYGDQATRWGKALDTTFGLRRGHRPAWCWTPLQVAAGSAPLWEHAAVTALAAHRGWIDTQDWSAIRQRVLGAAARGGDHADDERLIAAGRMWLSLVDDDQAAEIVRRGVVNRDPLAIALDLLACRMRDDVCAAPLPQATANLAEKNERGAT